MCCTCFPTLPVIPISGLINLFTILPKSSFEITFILEFLIAIAAGELSGNVGAAYT